MRLCKITLPFIHLTQRYIYGYLAFHILYMVVANGAYYGIDAFYTKQDLSDHLMSVMKIMQDVCFWSYILHCMAGVLASLATCLYLLVERTRNPTTADKYLSGSVTVLLMNLPYIVTIVVIGGIQFHASWELNSREIVFAWVPIFTSALDPVIVLARKKGVKEMLAASFGRSEKGQSTQVTKTQSRLQV